MWQNVVIAGSICLGLAGCQLALGDGEAESAAPAQDVEPAKPTAPVTSAEQKLVQMEAVEFFATQSLATRIAKACPTLNFDFRRNADVVALRGDPQRAFGASVKKRAVRARTAELEAAFLAKHSVGESDSDLCAAGRAEQSEGSALAASLRKAG